MTAFDGCGRKVERQTRQAELESTDGNLTGRSMTFKGRLRQNKNEFDKSSVTVGDSGGWIVIKSGDYQGLYVGAKGNSWKAVISGGTWIP